MTDIIMNTDCPDETFRRLRADRPVKTRLAPLLVTLLLHGLLFWWGLNSARLYAPSQGNIQAIRVFLQPLALPEPAVTSPPAAAKPGPAVSPAADPPVVALPRVASLLPPSVVSAPALSPSPVVATAQEAPPGPTVAVSVAPLPIAASAAVQAVPGVVGSRAGGDTAPVAPAGVANIAGVAEVGSAIAGAGKELYLRTLFAHIEAHKFYPPSARRRQLEGQVRVAFTIDASGGISDLQVAEGHPQLEEAARQTVRSALPLPLPAGGVTLPFSLSYRMDFRLR